jgi:hypothetical protein
MILFLLAANSLELRPFYPAFSVTSFQPFSLPLPFAFPFCKTLATVSLPKQGRGFILF